MGFIAETYQESREGFSSNNHDIVSQQCYSNKMIEERCMEDSLNVFIMAALVRKFHHTSFLHSLFYEWLDHLIVSSDC